MIFAMFSILPILLLSYAWWRFRFAFPRKYRYPGALLFVLLFACAFFHREIEGELLGGIVQAVGTFSFLFLVNWVICCIIWDIYLGIRRLRGVRKIYNKVYRMKREPVLASSVGLLTLAFFLMSIPITRNFKVTHEHVKLETTPKMELRIALFSDIHFDKLFPKEKLERIVDSLRILQPDAVFFAGDLADVPGEVLTKRGYDSLFAEINPPLGFFAAAGNHEGYGRRSEKATVEWMQEQKNLTLLLDETVCNEFFCVTGRVDRRTPRLPLKSLEPVNDSVPWFVLDHQPKGLSEEDTAGLAKLPDFAMSGHTHAGQFFPANLLINSIWELSYGKGELSGVPWFVTSGIGQWMPIRTFSSNELVMFSFE